MRVSRGSTTVGVSTGSTTGGVSTGSTTVGVSTGSTTGRVSTGSTTVGVSTGSTTGPVSTGSTTGPVSTGSTTGRGSSLSISDDELLHVPEVPRVHHRRDAGALLDVLGRLDAAGEVQLRDDLTTVVGHEQLELEFRRGNR